MKFMQRAAASSPTTNGSTTPTDSSPQEPASKRQRLSNGSALGRRSNNSDLEAVQAAMAEEELRKNQANERRAAEVGEERWVLDVPKSIPTTSNGALQVVMVSMADIDALSDNDDDSDVDVVEGRRKYGPNIKNIQSESRDSSDDSDESEDEEYDPMGLNDLIKESKKAVAKESEDDVIKFKSISNAGTGDIKCHRCGERGHMIRNCPMLARDKRKAQERKRQGFNHSFT